MQCFGSVIEEVFEDNQGMPSPESETSIAEGMASRCSTSIEINAAFWFCY